MTAFTTLIVVVLSAVVVRGDVTPLDYTAGKAEPTLSVSSTPLNQADPMSLGHGYSRRGDHIYFEGVRIDQAGRETLAGFQRTLGRRLTLANNVDAATFTALSEEYSKDKNTVYYKWISPGLFWVVEIPNADPATFEVIDSNLAKDARRVWRTDVPIRGADAATAEVVNQGWVWKDCRSVYYQFTRIAGADPKTFRHLDQAFYADANHVYWSDTRLNDADVKTFRTFGNDIPYAADARHVWSGATRLPNVDAESFRLLHNHVFADKNGAYVSTRALPILGADAATFQKVADLAVSKTALFSDARRLYLFDPYYGEIYTLTRVGNAVEITKPVWFGEAVGPVRHAATVSTTWENGTLSEPAVNMQPQFESMQKPMHEIEKLRRMTDAIREAMTLERQDARDGNRPRGQRSLATS